MTSDRVWDPSIHNDKISTSEHLKYLPTIPAEEYEGLFDIKGKLDIKTSLFNSTHTPNPEVILVKTIKEDEFENQDVSTINAVSIINDPDLLFIPVNTTININENGIMILMILLL